MPNPRSTQKYKHLFFDLDNTLFDFDGSAKLALEGMFVDFKLSEHFDSFDQFFNTYEPINSSLWDLYKENKVTKHEVKYGRFIKTLATVNLNNNELAKSLADDFLQKVSLQNLLIPDAIEVLDQLQPWYHLHIISNGFNEVQHKKLALTGLKKYFSLVVLSEQVKAQKPSATIFRHAVTNSNARKKESLMIGDNFNADIVGAKNFGMDQAFFEYRPLTTPPAFEPTYRIQKLTQLLAIL